MSALSLHWSHYTRCQLHWLWEFHEGKRIGTFLSSHRYFIIFCHNNIGNDVSLLRCKDLGMLNSTNFMCLGRIFLLTSVTILNRGVFISKNKYGNFKFLCRKFSSVGIAKFQCFVHVILVAWFWFFSCNWCETCFNLFFLPFFSTFKIIIQYNWLFCLYSSLNFNPCRFV